MKNVLLLFILFSSSAFASSWEAYLPGLKKGSSYQITRALVVDKIEKLGDAKIIEQVIKNNPSPFLEFVKVWYPQLLPQKVPGRRMFLSCYAELYQFTKNTNDSELKRKYKECLSYQFNEKLPESFQTILEYF